MSETKELEKEPNLSLIFLEMLGISGLFFYFFNTIIFKIITFLFVGLTSAFFVYCSLKQKFLKRNEEK